MLPLTKVFVIITLLGFVITPSFGAENMHTRFSPSDGSIITYALTRLQDAVVDVFIERKNLEIVMDVEPDKRVSLCQVCHSSADEFQTNLREMEFILENRVSSLCDPFEAKDMSNHIFDCNKTIEGLLTEYHWLSSIVTPSELCGELMDFDCLD